MTPAEPSSVRNKPLIVAKAVRLLYLSIAVGFVNFIFFGSSIITGVDILGFSFFFTLGCSAMAWLAHKIGEGSNWARIAFFIFHHGRVELHDGSITGCCFCDAVWP